ncbi:MAG TPA: hypothetical protein PK948_05190 [Gemmatimonadales bacterium]|nr:hypothetical protein [Gemmatimonadales bacterium]
MSISQRALGAAAFTLLLGFIASCSSDTTGNGDMNGTARAVLEPGINLSAAPDTVILDPNDPLAPRDPVTHALLGATTVSALVLDANLAPIVGEGVTFTTTAGTLVPAAQPIMTDAAGVAPDTLKVASDGPSEITVTATSASGTKSLVVLVDIAPTAEAGEDQSIYCPAPVTLDGSASVDPNSTAGTNDAITSFEWFLGDSLIADGEVVEVSLPVGINLVTLKVTDAVGASDTDDVTVTVVDTLPPVVTLHMSPDRLWPPNHRMKTVEALLDIQDCDTDLTVELVSVTSNEPDNGLGDGNTSGDIAGAALGTDDRSVQVRAERSGTGSGRVYTFVYRVTDGSGNSTDATATVTVPHDMGH